MENTVYVSCMHMSLFKHFMVSKTWKNEWWPYPFTNPLILLLKNQTSLVSWNPRGAMPVLNRYDAAEDELRPASAAAWRYDASSDSCEGDPSETPGWTKSLTQVNS